MALRRATQSGSGGRPLLDTVGRRIQVASGDAVYEGYAEGVDDDGSLLMRRDDGSVQTLAAGEVTLHL